LTKTFSRAARRPTASPPVSTAASPRLDTSTRGGEAATHVVGLRPESFELAAEGIPAEFEAVEEIGATGARLSR
jgi:hypothetical protein